MSNNATPRLWVNRAQLIAHHPAFTPSAITRIIAGADQNGLAPHIHWIDKQPVIDLRGFDQWVESQPSTRAEALAS